ncbi:MAG: chemotaxis protein CheW [Candidatus Electrothrix scaldis]|nr:MAG: chemotaxis protein CheW [Candidatus Electrothrix sp. GW3-3]
MRELLLLDLAGFRCGVWKEEILSHDEQSIHWLTDKEGPVRAIAMMGAHPVSLVDLSYCLGLAPARRGRIYPVLVPAGHDFSIGFVVEQKLGEVQVSASAVFSLPTYVQTSSIDSCVELDGELVPLINIQAIHTQVSQGSYVTQAPLLQLPAQKEEKASSLSALRGFSYNKKSFVASVDYFASEQALSPGSLTTLPLLPSFVRGITLHHQQVLTVLDIGRYLQLGTETEGQDEKWLISTVAGQGFAFVIHDDQGMLPAEAVALILLPLLIRSDWRQQAVLYSRKIIPVLDIRALLSCQTHEMGYPTLAPRLQADSSFEAAFGQEQVEIVEFSLCSMVHALPDIEVLDTFPFTHCQKLTETRGLVAGVTLYKDELLPVLDPARCFGRTSQPTPTWTLLLVCNGDLRALVLVEEVLGKRSLNISEQRQLPFTVPHSCVYGCYPMASRVGLILNILALTVYFDDEQSSELFLFADDLLPPVLETQEQQEGIDSNIEQGDQVGDASEAVASVIGQEEGGDENALPAVREESVEDDLSPFPVSGDLPLPPLVDEGEGEGDDSYHALEEKEPVASWDLEEKASLLLREEQDSLVKAVVASMLTRKAGEDADSATGESFADASLYDVAGLDESEETEDIFSSVVAAMLTGNGHDLDEEAWDIPELRPALKDGDTSASDAGGEEGDEETQKEEASQKTELHADALPPSSEMELPDEAESSFNAAPVLLTEEPDAVVNSTLALILQGKTEAPDEQVSGDENDDEEEDSFDVAAAEAVDSEKDTEPVSLTDEQEQLLQSSLVEAFLAQGEGAGPSSLSEGGVEEQAVAPLDVRTEEQDALLQYSMEAASFQEEDGRTIRAAGEEQDDWEAEDIFAALDDPADDEKHHTVDDPLEVPKEEQGFSDLFPEEEDPLHAELEEMGGSTGQFATDQLEQENEAPERKALGERTAVDQENDGRFIHDQLDGGAVRLELFDISVEKEHVEKEAGRKSAPPLEEGTPTSFSNILQSTYAFPELEEFAEQIAETEQVTPPFIEPPADFVKKAEFPTLLSPDPRNIKKRLDTLRRKEDEFLFQGVIHDEQEDEEPQELVSGKEDWRIKVWKILFLLALLCGFLLWFFVLRHDEIPQGKFIEPEPQRVQVGQVSREVDGEGADKEPVAVQEVESGKKVEDAVQGGDTSAKESDQSTMEYHVPAEGISEKKLDEQATQGEAFVQEDATNEQAGQVIPGAIIGTKPAAGDSQGVMEFAEESPSEQTEGAESIMQEKKEEGPSGGQGEEAERTDSLYEKHLDDNTLVEASKPIKEAEENVPEDMGQYDSARTGMTAVLKRIGKVARKPDSVRQKEMIAEEKLKKDESSEMQPFLENSLENSQELPQEVQEPQGANGKDAVKSEGKMPTQEGAQQEHTIEQSRTIKPPPLFLKRPDAGIPFVADFAEEQEKGQRKPQEERQENKQDKAGHNKVSEINSDISVDNSPVAGVDNVESKTGGRNESEVEPKDTVSIPLEEKTTKDQAHHTVSKGETLWKISEQYTGSGFNYPDVAKKNKIANPDLIYPNQQVELPAKK